MVNNCDSYEGYRSLYISADTGQTISYGAKPNYVIAYRPFEIIDTVSLTSRLRINISFFWKGLGVENYSYARFYFVDARDFDNLLQDMEEVPIDIDVELGEREDYQTYSVKEKLMNEGLFDEEKKLPIPRYNQYIGVNILLNHP